jgi:hypothetical protein
MKKALTVTMLLAGVTSVFSQGQISMSDYGSSFTIQIFNSQSFSGGPWVFVSYGGYSSVEVMGTSANSYLNSPGTTVFDANSALGTGYSVQLLAAPGPNDALSSLFPSSAVITTWYTPPGGNPTTGLNGFWKSGANAIILGAPPGSVATVALAAWDNEGGTVTGLQQAQAAGDDWGISMTGNTAPLGGDIFPPPNLPSSITSFSLAALIPEPSTITLGVLGASAFLLRLRRHE